MRVERPNREFILESTRIANGAYLVTLVQRGNMIKNVKLDRCSVGDMLIELGKYANQWSEELGITDSDHIVVKIYA